MAIVESDPSTSIGELLQTLADDSDAIVQMAAKAAVTEMSQRLKQGEEGWKE